MTVNVTELEAEAEGAYPHDGHGKTEAQLARLIALREGYVAGRLVSLTALEQRQANSEEREDLELAQLTPSETPSDLELDGDSASELTRQVTTVGKAEAVFARAIADGLPEIHALRDFRKSVITPAPVYPDYPDYEYLARGYAEEHAQVEEILAQALGYEHSEEYGSDTGDHTPVTLAMEAAKRLASAPAEASEALPRAGGCGCECHAMPGVEHMVACCSFPPARDGEPMIDEQTIRADERKKIAAEFIALCDRFSRPYDEVPQEQQAMPLITSMDYKAAARIVEGADS